MVLHCFQQQKPSSYVLIILVVHSQKTNISHLAGRPGPEKKLIFSPTPVLQVLFVLVSGRVFLWVGFTHFPALLLWIFLEKSLPPKRQTKREVQRHPVLVPSFQRLDDEQQELILYCLKAPKIPEKKVTCLETSETSTGDRVVGMMIGSGWETTRYTCP